MTANHYKPGELFRRFYLQNVEKNSFSEENTEEVDDASNKLSMESINVAELLKYLKEHKVKCDFNEKDSEQDLSAMYTEIRRCLAIDYFDEFGSKSTTQPENPLNEKNSEEYENYKKRILNLTPVPQDMHVKASFF